MSMLIAAADAPDVAAVILIVAMYIGGFVIGILLLLAPLMIWHWTKRLSIQLSSLRSLLSQEVAARRKDGKYIIALYEHVRHLDEVLTQPEDVQG